MSLALADFRAAFPEFDRCADAMVTAQLALAEARVDRTVADAASGHEKGDELVALRTAAALRRQMGQQAKGPPADYDKAADGLERIVGTAYRVIPGG